MFQSDRHLLRGTLDLLILKSLSWKPKHGYAIAEWIESATGSSLRIMEGTIYPALHRLENRGCVAADWGVSEKNRRAKYYSLTPRGEEQLLEQADKWQRYADAMSRAMATTSGGAE